MTYALTMMDPDGTLIARLPEAPTLPRFIHMTDEACALTDDAEPPPTAEHVTTFARVASSVWTAGDLSVGYIGQRDALFVRVRA